VLEDINSECQELMDEMGVQVRNAVRAWRRVGLFGVLPTSALTLISLYDFAGNDVVLSLLLTELLIQNN
jgi:hypothetical protein